jgi:hypothetical protein
MVRYRIRYEKVGPIRYTSHRDLSRIFRRCFATAEVPVCYSLGFNPHPRLSFGPSLRTGWEGRDEYLDILLERPIDDLGTRCNTALPEGLGVLEWAEAAPAAPKLAADVTAAGYEVTIDAAHLAESPGWADFLERIALEDGAAGDTPAAALEQDLRSRLQRETAAAGDSGPEPSLLDIHVGEQDNELRIEYTSTMHHGRSVFPDVLEPYFGNPRKGGIPMRIVRKSLFVARHGALLSPISKGVVQNLP